MCFASVQKIKFPEKCRIQVQNFHSTQQTSSNCSRVPKRLVSLINSLAPLSNTATQQDRFHFQSVSLISSAARTCHLRQARFLSPRSRQWPPDWSPAGLAFCSAWEPQWSFLKYMSLHRKTLQYLATTFKLKKCELLTPFCLICPLPTPLTTSCFTHHLATQAFCGLCLLPQPAKFIPASKLVCCFSRSQLESHPQPPPRSLSHPLLTSQAITV